MLSLIQAISTSIITLWGFCAVVLMLYRVPERRPPWAKELFSELLPFYLPIEKVGGRLKVVAVYVAPSPS